MWDILWDKESNKHRCVSCKYYIEKSQHCTPFNKWTNLPVKMVTFDHGQIGNEPDSIFREVLNSDGMCPHYIMSKEVKDKMKKYVENLREAIDLAKKEII